jgi:exosortase/archaeosortase family protein
MSVFPIRYKKELIILLIVLIVYVAFVFLVWTPLTQTFLYHKIRYQFLDCISFFRHFVMSLFVNSTPHGHYQEVLTPTAHYSGLFVFPKRWYSLYAGLFLGMFLLPPRKYYTGAMFVFAVLSIAIFKVLFKSIIANIVNVPFQALTLSWVYLSVLFPAYFWMKYIIKNNTLLLNYFGKIDKQILEVSVLKMDQIVLVLFFLTPIPRIILTYSGNFIQLFTHALLYFSREWLHLFGYEAVLVGDTLFLGKNWVQLYPPCLGIGVWFMVMLLITFIKGGYFLNKLVYLVFISIALFFINSLRLSALLLYIHVSENIRPIDFSSLHHYMNHSFYLAAFILLAVYVFWFHDLKFSICKKRME